MEQQQPILPPQTDDEIDLIALAKQVWNGRKIIFIALGIGAVLGLFVALTSPKEYTASTVMVPQMSNGSAKSSLSGLAALAGINMGMDQSADLSPILYPKIVNSVPFKLELMNSKFNFSEMKQTVSLFDYYTIYSKNSAVGAIKKYTIGLPGLIIQAIRKKPKELVLPKEASNQPIYLNKDQYEIAKTLSELVDLSVDAKEGYLTLTVRMPEALVAAQVTQKAQELLQREITNIKIEKARTELNFIQERYNVAKADFEKVQVDLASTTDRSRLFTSELSSIGKDRIQTRYNIAYTVYQELAKQLEQSKIQVEKDTPVFTIVEPVTIPSEKSKPKKAMILMIWIFLGGVIGVGIVFGKHFLQGIKQKWNESDKVIEPQPLENTEPQTTNGE